jgi:sialate O-acetylesterase
MKRRLASIFLWLVVLPVSVAFADVRLPAILSDGMVVQRDEPIPIWGWAEPGEQVTVVVAGQTATCAADAHGRWAAELEALVAGGPYTVSIRGRNEVVLSDVLVGDVWLCAGQSNMQRGVNLTEAGRHTISRADRPRMRLVTLDRVTSDEPADDAKLLTSWAPCSPASVESFSAVGYHFGAALQDELDVPIGLINCSWGGTRAEAWTSEPALRADPALGTVFERADRLLASPDIDKQRQHLPAALFNSLIAPLVDFPIAGVVWYQGESNESWPNEYRTLLPTLIADWRAQWGKPELPFGIVQLTAYRPKQIGPVEESRWAAIREAQWHASQSDSFIGLIVTTDLGDENNIHPGNKRDVGYRLALWALSDVYGRSFFSTGPVLRDVNTKEDQVVLTFDDVGSGLVARGGGGLRGFAVAGADQQFVWARARIDGDTVIVQAESVPEPVAVRYGWADYPIGNLFNANGLPAAPFRSDNWSISEDVR